MCWMELDASINLLVMSRLGRFIEDVGVVGQLHAEPGRDNRREASLVHLMCEPAREDERIHAGTKAPKLRPRDPQHAADGKAVLQC